MGQLKWSPPGKALTINWNVEVVLHETRLTRDNPRDFPATTLWSGGTDNFTRYLTNVLVSCSTRMYGPIFRFEGQASLSRRT